DLRACPDDDGASPSLAGLPHHAGLGSGFGSSSPSSGASTSSRSHLMVGTLAWPCGSGHHGLRRTCTSYLHDSLAHNNNGPPASWLTPVDHLCRAGEQPRLTSRPTTAGSP